MKAIIIAGGVGTRLGKYAKDLPKCMLKFAGKSLLERQVEIYRKAGINDIIVIKGHLGDKINLPNLKYVDWAGPDTNMVVGLFQARKSFDDDILISYGDVLFEQNVLEKVIKNKAEVGVVADTSWKEYWTARLGDWRKDSESFVIGKNNKILSLGISNPSPDLMHARYVGIIKFSKNVLLKIEKIYDEAAEKFWDKPFRTSKSFKKVYMTDFIQELIDRGLDVEAVKIQRGWLEFDTEDDYELTCKWLREGDLDRFINL